jgi:hypothetical protein
MKSKIRDREMNKKKSLSVSFLVISCPTCCNISSDLNKFFAVSDYRWICRRTKLLTQKKVEGTFVVIVLFLVASCIP